MAIEARRVKELRDRTGAGMMDCKRALTESGGNIDKAIAVLREKGLAGASKKAGRVAAEGLVAVFSRPDLSTAVLLELNCETDFVAKTDEFSSLVSTAGTALLHAGPGGEGDGDLVAGLSVEGGGTMAEFLKEGVASIGENLGLRRFVRLESTDGAIGSYVHAGGKIGVVVEVAGAQAADEELLRSLAMQIAAAIPRCVGRQEVSPEEIEKERDIFAAQARSSGKPEKVVDRIVDGKMDKYFREICLLEQEYVRDSDLTVAALLEQAAEKKGSGLEIKRFFRFQLGEGVERKTANLADEVAAQIAQGS